MRCEDVRSERAAAPEAKLESAGPPLDTFAIAGRLGGRWSCTGGASAGWTGAGAGFAAAHAASTAPAVAAETCTRPSSPVDIMRDAMLTAAGGVGVAGRGRAAPPPPLLPARTRVPKDAVEAPRSADDARDDGTRVEADAHGDWADARHVAAEREEVGGEGAHDDDVVRVLDWQPRAQQVRVCDLSGALGDGNAGTRAG